MANLTRQVALTADRESWYSAAWEKFNPERMRRLLADLVDIHSPTGDERAICEFLSGYLRRHLGGRGFYQPINEHTGNCFGAAVFL